MIDMVWLQQLCLLRLRSIYWRNSTFHRDGTGLRQVNLYVK